MTDQASDRIRLATLEAGGCAIVALIAGAFVCLSVREAGAQSGAEFFRGKELVMAIPSGPGGGYDASGRILARYLPKYIPGNPRMIPQNVPAGGGLVLSNVLYNTAPKDGSYLAVMRGSALYEDIFKNPVVKFSSLKMHWIGNMSRTQDSCLFSVQSGVTSTDDFFKREITIGATGVGAMAYSFPAVYNDVLGTKFKIVMGYKGSADRVLAMERGELEGACGITTGNLRSTFASQFREGRVKFVAQAGLTKDPGFPNVPNILDLSKTVEQRQALAFLLAQLEIGRPIALPPETPADRVAILQRAFDETVKDPDFVAESQKLGLDLDPMSGVETANAVAQFFATPEPVIQRVNRALTKNAQ